MFSLSLPFPKVQDLISNSQLNISCEEKVFTAVLNWIKHDLNERRKHISLVTQPSILFVLDLVQ
jgi:kelch-like protein 17 (actinfilin)